jgi:tRNA pseudouridine38-40 synthase
VIYYYKLTIQYKGSSYIGWQIQPDSSGLTVQGELYKALRTISKSQNVKSMGAGRTDTGVHALGQVVKIAIELNIKPENLRKALNVNLPDDIRVTNVEVSDEAFLPTIFAKSKEYHYRFTCNETFSPFQKELIYNYPFELDLEKMKEACQLLIGTHDFSNFYCKGTEVSHNIREIYECEILEVAESSFVLPSHYVFRIVGNGFLKQMVRLLMGALWHIGRGKVTLDEFKNSLGPIRVQRLGPVAPPNGLYMVCVNY